ncbi:MAG: outer membrane protein transport protein [Candidatus Zixiibacteriota bacterium]
MRLVVASAVLVVLVGWIVAPVSGAGFDYAGIGTKARGMGGAFRAIADDWTAAYYNPAGYALALDNQLGGAVGLFHLRHELNPNYRWGGQYEPGAFDPTCFNRHEILSVPATGFIVRLPVWGETVFGLSAYQTFDYNITWELYQPLGGYNPNVEAPEDQYQNNLDVVAFQLTAAREFLEDQLALGVGIQVLRGDLVFNNVLFREHPLAGVPGWDPEIYARPREKIQVLNYNNGRGWGGGLTAGALWTLNETVRVGATVRFPFQITIKGEALSAHIMPDAESLWKDHSSPEVKNPGSVGHLFLAGEVVNMYGDFETVLRLPPSVGLGVSFTPTERLTIALDAEYTFWSRFDGFKFAYTNHQVPVGPADTSALVRNFLTADVSFPVDWNNTVKAMVGASYDVNPHLTLIGGGLIDQSPADDSKQFTPLFVDTGTKFGFSGGFIVHIDRWDLGLATTYLHYPDLEVAAPADFGVDEDFVMFPGDYKADSYETLLSFNYRF